MFFKKRIKPVKRAEKEFLDGMHLAYVGERITLRTKISDCRRISVRRVGEELRMYAGPAHTDADMRAALIRWYRGEARRILTEKSKSFAAVMGLKFNKIFIKDQKTRWGSCSSLGNLNYNFRLVMGPHEIMDYLVVHELCHLVHPNHSRGYWDMVSQYFPRHKEARKWLKEHGSSLKQL